jgi:cell division control protein 6
MVIGWFIREGVVFVGLEEYFRSLAEGLRSTLLKFKDPSVFDLNVIPKRIYERKELLVIASKLAEYAVLGIPNNFIVYGPRGSGKTVSILHLLENAKRVLGLKTFYIRARECPISYHIYRKMAGVSKMGYSTEELRTRALGRFREKAVIAIDDADFLEDFEFLNYFSRNSRASIILLAQSIQFSKRIDEATYSSLQPSKIYFSEYNADDLYQILRMRAEDGLREWNEGVLRLISAITARDYRGDARVAIRSLFRVAIIDAWRDEERVKSAISEASREVEEMCLRELRDQDLIALYAVSRVKETNKAYLVFNEYMEKIEGRTLTKPVFFKTLNYLQNLGLITEIRKRVGRYYTIEVDLLIASEMVEKEFKTRFQEVIK